MLKLKSIKTQLILYLTCFAIFLSFQNKNAAFLVTTIIAVISALAAESTILYFKTRVFQISESSIITGLIVGYVVFSDEAWWRFVSASLLAIFSKYLIRFHKKHIFNPAAFGIFLAIIIFGAST
ncbi:MAG: RnfABCDGE type electron transport complex subunit D [Candidatus Omnitrophica bacterium]|jgi:Na+-transporting NADH:ubiquinone oxidoreductase subunit NqrB|nr:RnfABCDGE type electron transport complex subunit D [Candidatus Omnitrophota bacterium]